MLPSYRTWNILKIGPLYHCHTQLNVCEKEGLQCFSYLIQIFVHDQYRYIHSPQNVSAKLVFPSPKVWDFNERRHGLRTPRQKIAFSARPKIHSHSQIFRYSQRIFCLPHRPNFSDIFDLCLYWLSVVRDPLSSCF